MKTPYLIQRARFASNPMKVGIDSILSFDYMGASEYEWGAMPDSLKRIRKNKDKYIYFHLQFKNKIITVLAPVEFKQTVSDYIIELSQDKLRLKCWAGFKDYINQDGYFKDKFSFWWDLENDFMFWKNDEKFTQKFGGLI